MNNIIASLKTLIEFYDKYMGLIVVKETSLWANTGWDVKANNFNDFLMHYFVSGDITYYINNDFYQIKAGDVFFVDNSLPNGCKTTDFCMFYISIGIDEAKGKNAGIYNELKCVFKALTGKVINIGKSGIENRFNEILSENVRVDFEHDRYIKLSLFQSLIDIYRHVRDLNECMLTSYENSKYVKIVNDIIQYISMNVEKNLSLKEISNRYMLDARYLNKIFVRNVNCPIKKFQQVMKIKKAKQLLLYTTMNVTDIAMMLNYSSSQHFSTRFKQITGLSPTEYKKLIKYSDN